VTAQQTPDNASCVALSIITPAQIGSAEVLTIDLTGGAKRGPLDDYPRQKRGGKGVLSGAEQLAWCGVVTDVHVVAADGPQVVRAAQIDHIGRSGRPSPTTSPPLGPVVGEQRGADAIR
jgi:hypothetical protein